MSRREGANWRIVFYALTASSLFWLIMLMRHW